MQQLKSGFKRKNNWNKHQSKVTIETQSQYLNYLINPNFRGVNRVFVLSIEYNAVRTAHTRYIVPTTEIKDYKIMIDGQDVLDHPIKNDLGTYDKT